ncbi:MAG: hypothetical protein MJA83_10005, partial [Gammaproteobacteria bacterium]|nr:hypothetical protein [Gammaproteobacteria bacterium]
YPPTSRHKNTRYFKRRIKGLQGFQEVIEQETWIPPEIPVTQNDLRTKVEPGEIGRLDLIALRVYNNSSLWWVIAFVNDIVDPFEEATAGRELRYPPFETVASTVLA